jgi:hypothetical protein
MPDWVRYVVIAACIIALAIAVFWSKRGSMGEELAKSAGMAEEPAH